MWDECNKNGGLIDCLRAFLVSCSALFKSNTLHFIVLSSPILALERADMKNNNGLRFDIRKSIETDVNLPTKNIQFLPPFGALFCTQMRRAWKTIEDSDSASSKIFQSNTLNFIPFLGSCFDSQVVRMWKIMADLDSASPKILNWYMNCSNRKLWILRPFGPLF